MEIIDRLTERGIPGPYENREALDAGWYHISIQASRGHYCSPRVDGLPISSYTTVEIALFDCDYNWLRLTRSPMFYSWEKSPLLVKQYGDGPLDPDNEWSRGGECYVFGYVPIELVEDLYQHMKHYRPGLRDYYHYYMPKLRAWIRDKYRKSIRTSYPYTIQKP